MDIDGKNLQSEQGVERSSVLGGHLRNSLTAELFGLSMVGLMAFGIGGLHLRAAAVQSEDAGPPMPVAAVTVRLQASYTVQDRFAGRLEAARQTSLSFERRGLVTEVLFDEGDSIPKGAVVARLDTAPLLVERDRLLAERRAIEARLSLARLTSKRQSVLKDKGHSSVQRFDEARYSVAELEAGRATTDAAIRAVDIDIDKSSIKAPFGGLVASRSVDEGAVVAPGAAILELLETERTLARIGVSPAAAEQLSAGMTYTLRPQGGTTLPARLKALRPDLATGTRTVTALFELGAVTQVPLGEIVEIAIAREISEPGAWLPMAALTEGRKGMWSVLTLTDGDTGPLVARESVEIVHVEGDRVFVRGTVSDGDRVVTGGTQRVIPGQRVVVAGAEG